MSYTFHKYHGAGNDFLLLDDRRGGIAGTLDRPTIAAWCRRHFGVGADGLMLLRSNPEYDFEMVYFNADGSPSTLCGNGSRCIVLFARALGIEREEYRFLAADGPHRARLLPDGQVALEMHDVVTVHSPKPEAFVLDTGSPHYVAFVAEIDEVDVVKEGRAVRNLPPYAPEGINVNFVSGNLSGLRIATYERGVEGETLACGTGVTAAAIAAVQRVKPAPGPFSVPVVARGGELRVEGHYDGEAFRQLWLIGPASYVYSGTVGQAGPAGV